jgi:hypothetical protein
MEVAEVRRSELASARRRYALAVIVRCASRMLGLLGVRRAAGSPYVANLHVSGSAPPSAC